MADSVALAALIVSLVALFTTTGQLLQQYFATADGLRRCQASVMGLWAQKTKLRWRWKEFRFETTFVIPRIRSCDSHGIGLEGFDHPLINSPESLQRSMTYPGWGSFDANRYYGSDQLACWVPLLAMLHRQGQEAVKYFPQQPGSNENDSMIPVIELISKGWDFMPPDVLRPLASSTVSDIAIMARRLGMTWKSFDPGAGSLRAEGNGHVITSTMVRSLGTVIQYTYTSRQNLVTCAYIPVKEADKLGFGLVELDTRLFGINKNHDSYAIDVSSYDGVALTINRLVPRSQYINPPRLKGILKRLKTTMTGDSKFIPGLNDLIPICSAMLTTKSAPFIWARNIPTPTRYAKGVTSCEEGFRVFEIQLQRLNAGRTHPSDQSQRIQRCFVNLNSKSSGRWLQEDLWDAWELEDNPADVYDAKIAKDIVIRYHFEMTEYLRKSSVDYSNLVLEHLAFATEPPTNLNAPGTGADPYLILEPDIELLRSMESYFSNLPKLVLNIVDQYKAHPLHAELPPLSEQEIEDAWLSMIFRAFCWQRSHVMLAGSPPLPSEYWNSKMPVYIG
ncbi:hypothetical protein B0O99DRAFT_79704 [Bisporella sp. PMI_857]|nr:hypothetical protein B0O99DRAFT_79704 [Bisporella sp. PMI_857]